ncbi:LOW QUALITY PROTEIN: uncharacterized protein LOC122056142 [Zingiber officinale]|uniref:LOW QUALITY PROTEIN: uncharacterized protein LOC122056142 n=1 Tax=Zingiber officinale TaxID=94328 RepID=UPI001C4B2606|nr:LOW QUALITY PROTEIN: uncharacterized protein LOC122056142 [Zingiber officinale]
MGGGRRRPNKNGGRGRAQAAGANTFSYGHAILGGRPGGGSAAGPARIDGDRRMRGRANAFRYTYAHAESSGGGDDLRRPILLSCSRDPPRTEAFVDPNPCVHLEAEIPSYEYHPSVVGGLGLGYHGEEVDAEQEDGADTLGLDLEMMGGVGLGFRHAEEGEEEEVEDILGLGSFSTPETTKNVRNEGYLLIGGVRIYTEDASSPEDEIDMSNDDDSDDEDADQVEDGMLDIVESSDNENDMEEPSQGDSEEDEEEDSSSDGVSLPSDSDSDIDDDVAQDYLEGIGEDVKLLNIDSLESANFDSSDEDGLPKSGKNLSKHRTKLTTIGLMNLSSEYGMKKPKAKKPKGHMRYSTGWPAADVGVSAVEDFILLKDSRKACKKKKSSSDLSQSWPRESVTRRRSNVPGEKKKHRKELVAVKRRQRMINRGVDLDQINYKLRQLVVNEVDMYSFQPMHARDCSQVQRLASVYHLKSGCQGSGKKRFVTVSRTQKTCLPSIRDKIRLDKLLGPSVDEVDDFVVGPRAKTERWRRTKAKGSITREHQSDPAKLAKKHEANGSGRRFQKQQYSKQPVSFVSSGVMQDGTEKETPAMDPDTTTTTPHAMVTNTGSSIGAFEVHTKGFGSRMMAKMGFVEGSGLGKEGQGIVQPIEVVQRPKSLGLGIQFEAETSITKNNGQGKTETDRIGAFENHTKGFGSRMMAKMGFVPGTGLGRDGQGITTPLTAVRRPKSRGLGAKTS